MTKSRLALPQLVGVIHLPALVGAPSSSGIAPTACLRDAGFRAIEEAKLLVKSGFEGIILENFGDAPFYSDQVPPETVASLSVIAAAVREFCRIPIGLNVLRNDARSALAIASVVGCDFIRVNVLTGVAATDQGLIQGRAEFLLRERARLNSSVAILSDIQVKHAVTLSSHDIAHSLEDTVSRGLADGVIVTGAGTGKVVDPAIFEKSCEVAKSLGVPLYVGSGAQISALPALRKQGAGVIVSSSLRKGGRAGAPLDAKKVRDFAKAFFKKSVGTKKRK